SVPEGRARRFAVALHRRRRKASHLAITADDTGRRTRPWRMDRKHAHFRRRPLARSLQSRGRHRDLRFGFLERARQVEGSPVRGRWYWDVVARWAALGRGCSEWLGPDLGRRAGTANGELERFFRLGQLDVVLAGRLTAGSRVPGRHPNF